MLKIKNKKKFGFLFCAFYLIQVHPLLAENVSFQISGINDELKKNVSARLSKYEGEKSTLRPGFRSQAIIEMEVKKGLRAIGYYEPTVLVELLNAEQFETRRNFERRRSTDERNTENKETHLNNAENQQKNEERELVFKIQIEPNEPILNKEINVNYFGDANEDPIYIEIKENIEKNIDEILNHNDYEAAKSMLTSTALKRGYFTARLNKSQLGVSEELHSAYWVFDFDSGKRFRFGQVNFKGSQIEEQRLQNIVPFNEGEYYTMEQLSLLNQRLSETNWFRSVSALPDPNNVGEDQKLPINVTLEPRRANRISTGIGYSTSVGPRTKINWTKPWLNDDGDSLSTALSVSQVEQKLAATYKMPLLKEPLVHYYLFSTELLHENNNDTKSNSAIFSIFRQWDFRKSWQRAIGINMHYDDFTQGDVQNQTFLLYPTVTISRIRSDGKLMPMWGDYQQYSISYSNNVWGSQVDFFSATATNTWIRSYKDNNRFVIRASAGFLDTNEFDRMPPSLRFFEGGDRSVRGYGYQSISPRNSKGELTGGDRSITASAEYQRNFSGNWWGAVFWDAGDVSFSLNNFKLKHGAGAGIRWSSPVGPVKFDIAFPVNGDKVKPHLYIGIGSEL